MPATRPEPKYVVYAKARAQLGFGFGRLFHDHCADFLVANVVGKVLPPGFLEVLHWLAKVRSAPLKDLLEDSLEWRQRR